MNIVSYPLRLYYDAACPVCALEMNELHARDRLGRLTLIDISAPGFTGDGFDRAALDAAMHAQDAQGRVLIGLDAIVAAYSAVGLGALWRPMRWPLLRGLGDSAYRLFARHRRAISAAAAPFIEALARHRARRAEKAMSTCRDGGCDIHSRS